MYFFYFPERGNFAHFPTNVSINRQVVAKAPIRYLAVKKVQTKVNYEDFDDILATGSIPDILKFMAAKNLTTRDTRFRFEDIYWLCKDQTFYREALKILKSKNLYDSVFWSYSIFHKDEATMKEFFESSDKG